jgi:hypothetical protein
MLKNISLIKLYKSIGTLKFAIVVMSTLITMLIVGTLVEVQYGPIVAQYYIYHSKLFFLNSLLIIASLTISMLERPFNKNYYGFYLIHIGLIILGVGALISIFASTEGQIDLYPNDTQRKLRTNSFEIQVHKRNLDTALVKLPESIFPVELDIKLDNFKITKYIPFAKSRKDIIENKGSYVYELSISNDKVFEEIQFTNDLNSPFYKIKQSLGPLQIQTFDTDFGSCLSAYDAILINTISKECIKKDKLKLEDKKLITFTYKGVTLKFAPSFSSFPINDEGREIIDSNFQLLSLKSFRSRPTLWITPKASYYYDEETLSIKKEDQFALAWMNLQASLVKKNESSIAQNYVDDKVKMKRRPAIRVENSDGISWVNLKNSLAFKVDNIPTVIELKNQKVILPFEITLSNFEVKKDFGTGKDASYKTTVSLRDTKEVKSLDITLNNPIKYNNFTIYQDSYKKLESNRYLSVLKVNIDSGRFFKYAGWAISLLGMLIHFRKRKIRL